jgi:hypothetical protein
MSGTPPAPDRWSDHDFFVVTRSGAQGRFRASRDWLPAPDRIVLFHRETAHGLKMVWDDGHLAELAVFDPDELALARVNRWRLLLDRAELWRRLDAVRDATASATEAIDLRFEVGQLLCALLVGGMRAARGEQLSGGQFVRAHAARHFLRRMEEVVPAAPEAAPDDLDPFRRVELGWPAQARALDAALAEPLSKLPARSSSWQRRPSGPAEGSLARRCGRGGARGLEGRVEFTSLGLA